MKVIVSGAGWEECVEVEKFDTNSFLECASKALDQRLDRGESCDLGLTMSLNLEGADEADEQWGLTSLVMEYREDRVAEKKLKQAEKA